MSKDVTHVYFLLDQTGSMVSYLDQTISGFNEYVAGLKKKDNFKLTLVLFNTEKIETRYKEAKIKDVSNLNKDTYVPDSTTPLYDALGSLIKEAEASRKKKDKVLFVILTDGLENASREYTQKQIFDLIGDKRKNGWEFVYLGANQDAWAVSASIGINVSNVSSYNQKNTKEAFSVAMTASCRYAGGMSANLISSEEADELQSY